MSWLGLYPGELCASSSLASAFDGLCNGPGVFGYGSRVWYLRLRAAWGLDAVVTVAGALVTDEDPRCCHLRRFPDI